MSWLLFEESETPDDTYVSQLLFLGLPISSVHCGVSGYFLESLYKHKVSIGYREITLSDMFSRHARLT
jgi:hypothetical protein